MTDICAIACHFNPAGYSLPVANFGLFWGGMKNQGVPLYLAELAYQDAPFLLAESDQTLRLRSSQVLWQKEALLNAVEKIVPAQFTKLAFVDADILFHDDEWLSKASTALESQPLIQLFRRAILTDRDGNHTGVKSSVGFASSRNDPRRREWQYFHPGFAWAARRELWTRYGGLYSRSIIGQGDTALALAAMDSLSPENPHLKPLNPAVLASLTAWGKPIAEWTGGKIGCLSGDIMHLYHGGAENRNYAGRLAAIRTLEPETDLELTPGGILAWTPAAQRSKSAMIRAVKDYFWSRQEDN